MYIVTCTAAAASVYIIISNVCHLAREIIIVPPVDLDRFISRDKNYRRKRWRWRRLYYVGENNNSKYHNILFDFPRRLFSNYYRVFRR